MKKPNQIQSSSATRRTASAKLILTGMIAAAASFALPTSSHAQISPFPFTLDGQFTGSPTPFAGLTPGQEWFGVTPFSFISSPSGTIPTSNSNPLRNTQLYAAIGTSLPSPFNPAPTPGLLNLHLMYDFLPRTTAPELNQVFATVTFPVTLPGRTRDNISVILRGVAPAVGGFDILVDLDVNDPLSPLSPLRVNGVNSGLFPGLLAATAPGPSPLSASPHLRVELLVPLRIPAGFGASGPLNPGGAGINPATGMYDPDPVFWGAAAGRDGQPLVGDDKGGAASFGEGLQDATSAFIGINPDGSLTVTPTPEPSTAMLLLGSLAMLGARRRKSASAA